MRKIAIMAGLVSVFSLGYAGVWEAVDSKYGYETEELEVRANVVKTLDLEVEGVDFGNVPSGKVKDYPDKNGKISVTGSSGETVRLFILNGAENLGSSNSLVVRPIVLKHVGDGNSSIEYSPEFSLNNELTTTNSPTYSLNEEGKLALTVKGKIDAGKASSLGEYTSTLTVRVKYE